VVGVELHYQSFDSLTIILVFMNRGYLVLLLSSIITRFNETLLNHLVMNLIGTKTQSFQAPFIHW